MWILLNVPIANVINEIGIDLHLDVYVATPLEQAGNVTIKAKEIHFDDLLTKMFENQVNIPAQNELVGQTNTTRNRAPQNQNNIPAPRSATNFTYKKEGKPVLFWHRRPIECTQS